MSFTIVRDEGTLIAKLDGRLEGGTSLSLQKSLEEEIKPDDKALILNMENLSYISSSGLRVVAIMFNRTKATGMKLAICSMSDSINKVITTSGFHMLIPVFSTQEEAYASVADPIQ